MSWAQFSVYALVVDMEPRRNIVTYHAEDGSGNGSAIVAAMTKLRKDAGVFPAL